MTGAPSSAASLLTSIATPSFAASSAMFSTTTNGTPVAFSARTSGSCSSTRVALTTATIASRATVPRNVCTRASSSV